ncbi:MAG: hypothetical protein NT012_02555 [Candidatus Nealsonbacteria bacterium]|jgi:hypothetical protein|nr:hypothetical protein [Candidatus Nealsonbacteria bacterium]
MTKITLFWYIFLILSFIGFYLAYLYGKKTTEFRWSEYIAIIIIPILFIVFLILYYDFAILKLFIVSASIGFAAEGLIGFVYDKVLNRRLWTYNRLSIKGYTSYLSIPLWGIAGVIFWFITKLVGL